MFQIECFDVSLHSIGHARVHGGASTQYNVVVQSHPVVHVHFLQDNFSLVSEFLLVLATNL